MRRVPLTVSCAVLRTFDAPPTARTSPRARPLLRTSRPAGAETMLKRSLHVADGSQRFRSMQAERAPRGLEFGIRQSARPAPFRRGESPVVGGLLLSPLQFSRA